MLVLYMLMKKWQGHPTFKSEPNLISESYPKRAGDKGKEKGLGRGRGRHKKSEEEKMGSVVGLVNGYLGNRKILCKRFQEKILFL